MMEGNVELPGKVPAFIYPVDADAKLQTRLPTHRVTRHFWDCCLATPVDLSPRHTLIFPSRRICYGVRNDF